MTKPKLRLAIALALAAAVALCAAYAIGRRRETIPILMYHHLVADGGETNALTVTEGKFRRDMEFLRESGCTTLTPDELCAVLAGERECPAKPVVISFDDGYQSNYSIAYPILRETGCHAVIALITANIREQTEDGAFMLSWPQVEEMAASGAVSFGTHTHDLHNPDTYGELRRGRGAVNGVERLPDETRQEYCARVGADLSYSAALIEAHTGAPVRWFAYPYGAVDEWCEEELDEWDIPISVSTKPGRVKCPGKTRVLPRYAVHEDTEISKLIAG